MTVFDLKSLSCYGSAFTNSLKGLANVQISIAVSIYLVVAIMKKELGLKQSLYEILQILSITLFQKELITTAPLSAEKYGF